MSDNTITLVWRTDVHLAVKSPSSRTDNWADAVLDKLVQVGDIAREVGADAVIDGGDFFHIKSPSRTTHALIQRVAEVHSAYPCPVWAVRNGNHDVKFGDGEFLDEAPLGVLFKTGVFKMIPEEGKVFTAREHDEMHGSVIANSVRICAVPYHGTTYDMSRLDIKKGKESHLMVAAHLLASKAGGDMFGGEDIVKYADLVDLDPDVWCFGHWHKNQGVTEMGGKHIVNIGSLTRGALSQDDLERIPEVAIIRFHEGRRVTVERRPLKVRPASEVFDLEGRVRELATGMTVDSFVESVKATLEKSSGASVLDDVQAMDLPGAVKERLTLLLEESA